MFATCNLILPFLWRTAAGGVDHCFSGPFCHLASHPTSHPAALALHLPRPVSCYTVRPWSLLPLLGLVPTSLCLECSFSGYLPGPLLSFRFLLGSKSHTTRPVPCPASFPWLHSHIRSVRLSAYFSPLERKCLGAGP